MTAPPSSMGSCSASPHGAGGDFFFHTAYKRARAMPPGPQQRSRSRRPAAGAPVAHFPRSTAVTGPPAAGAEDLIHITKRHGRSWRRVFRTRQ